MLLVSGEVFSCSSSPANPNRQISSKFPTGLGSRGYDVIGMVRCFPLCWAGLCRSFYA